MNTHDIENQRAAFEAAIGRGKTYTERDFDMFRLGLDRQGRGEPVGMPINASQAEKDAYIKGFCYGRRHTLERTPQPAAPVVKESLTVAEPVEGVSDLVSRLREADKPLMQHCTFSEVRDLLREAADALERVQPASGEDAI